jgi:hypothetical protein
MQATRSEDGDVELTVSSTRRNTGWTIIFPTKKNGFAVARTTCGTEKLRVSDIDST